MTKNTGSRLNLAHDNTRDTSTEFNRGLERLNKQCIPEAGIVYSKPMSL